MKRNNQFRLAALSCALLMALTGCGSPTSDTSSAAGTQTGGETQEESPVISVLVYTDEDTVLTDENHAISWLKEKTGVNLEFQGLPSTEDASTKLNLMLANGDYTDVIACGLSKQQAVELGTDGIFIPLNDLLEQYGENLNELFEIRPNYLKNITAPDGNIYGLPSINECYHCTAYPKLWYNTEWLDSMGLEIPTTTEEFEAMLLAAKDSDYNGNGEADEIPLTGNTDWDCQVEWTLLNYFIPCDRTTLSYAKDGEVVLAVDKDEFKQGLEWIHSLYQQGLIDPASFSQGSDQMMQTIRSDYSRVFAYTADHFGLGIDQANEDMNRVISALEPVEGPTGARYQLHNDYSDQSSGLTWFITDKCEDPEAAFKVGDFLASSDIEVNMNMNWGEEGVFWGYLEEPVPSIMEGIDALVWEDSSAQYSDDKASLKNNVLYVPVNSIAELRAAQAAKPENMYTGEAYEARLYEETAKVEPYFYPEYLPKTVFLQDEDEAEQFNTIRTSLQEYVRTSVAQFITGELSLENDWESYVSTLQNYDVETYLSLYQKFFDEYNSAENE